MISTVVLTKNRAQLLRKCLSALKWSDEVVVVDDNSTDDTRQVVEDYKNARYFRHELNDFAQQHNYALAQVKSDWILFVDDDEIVSTELAQEIQKALQLGPAVNGFLLKRQDFFMGRILRFGETANVKLLRLGKKSAGKWSRTVHERWEISAPLDALQKPLLHYPHPTVTEFLTSINYYTSIDAKHMLEQDKIEFSLFRLLANPVGKFIQNYVLRLGFLDGVPGLVMAFMMSFHSLTVRVKQYDLSTTS